MKGSSYKNSLRRYKQENFRKRKTRLAKDLSMSYGSGYYICKETGRLRRWSKSGLGKNFFSRVGNKVVRKKIYLDLASGGDYKKVYPLWYILY